MVNYREILRLLDLGYTQRDIAKLFHPDLYGTAISHKEPDYAYMHAELAKKGMNLTLLWIEYCAECYTNGDNPYMYTQFCEKYRQWAKLSKATMRIKHKPGDVMQVDWAGATIRSMIRRMANRPHTYL